MSYFQKYMRINGNENQSSHNFCKNSHATPISNPNKFKKHPPTKSKVSQCVSLLEDHTQIGRSRERQNDLNHAEPCRPKPQNKTEFAAPRKPQLKGIQKLNLQCQKNVQGDKMNSDFQTLMIEADNSMQQLLNSSINQFSKYLQGENLQQDEEEHQHLIKQNEHLRTSLEQLKVILKGKLQNALKKQKEELNTMMEDYIGLITKLLKDKEELTTELEKRDNELREAQLQRQNQIKEAQKMQIKIEELAREKDQHIQKTKKQIEDFLNIIDQYEEEGQQENKENEQMRQRIQQLEQQIKVYEQNNNVPQSNQQESQQKIAAQASKIQVLIELLEQYQNDNTFLRENLNRYQEQGGGESRIDFQTRLQELQREHQQEFIEYERAMRQTLNKKDECIQRLNMIIESYRSKRERTKEGSFDTTVSLPNDPSN